MFHFTQRFLRNIKSSVNFFNYHVSNLLSLRTYKIISIVDCLVKILFTSKVWSKKGAGRQAAETSLNFTIVSYRRKLCGYKLKARFNKEIIKHCPWSPMAWKTLPLTRRSFPTAVAEGKKGNPKIKSLYFNEYKTRVKKS